MTNRKVQLAAGSIIAIHFMMWVFIAFETDESFSALLSHWDSGWYNRIISEGYRDNSWAFMPLYPMTIRALSGFLPGVPISVIGTIFSTVLYFLSLNFLFSLNVGSYSWKQIAVVPRTNSAWVIFLLAPASYVFHTHHTEALFLFTTVLSLYFVSQQNIFLSAIFAGLAALTRIQGFIFILGMALFWLNVAKSKKTAFDFFVISVLIASLYPIYQWYQVGNPLHFVSAQESWTQSVGVKVSIWLKALWLGNEWQPKSIGSIIHNVFFLGGIFYSLSLLRQSVPLAVYCLLSLCCMFPQGEFVDSLRYSVVLFPLYFKLGDDLSRFGPAIRYLALTAFFVLNLAVCYNYGIGRWAY